MTKIMMIMTAWRKTYKVVDDNNDGLIINIFWDCEERTEITSVKYAYFFLIIKHKEIRYDKRTIMNRGWSIWNKLLSGDSMFSSGIFIKTLHEIDVTKMCFSFCWIRCRTISRRIKNIHYTKVLHYFYHFWMMRQECFLSKELLSINVSQRVY